MDLLTSFRMSWRGITDHSLRSTLTTLGVVIGVGAVITFVILGASLQADIVQTIAGENTDVLRVSASSGTGEGIPSVGGGGQPVFTEHDISMLRNVSGVRWVIPQSGIAASNVRYRNDFVGRQFVTVTTRQFFQARRMEFVAGRPYFGGQHEVVLNQRAASMFAENVTVGSNLTIVRAATNDPINATVVGIVSVTETDGPTGIGGGSGPQLYVPPRPFYDRTVVSPTTDDRELVYPQLVAVARDVEEVEAVQGRLQTRLATDSDARILAPGGYRLQVTTYDELVGQIQSVSSTFTAYIAGVALISLVVGAIGIANIMLVSVTERRREIGIMKAIGAERRDILQLFLNEAVMLGIIGAAFGTVGGLVAGYAATEFINLPFRARPQWFLAAVVVGVLIGVLAGVYPAWSAARTDPIDALRYK